MIDDVMRAHAKQLNRQRLEIASELLDLGVGGTKVSSGRRGRIELSQDRGRELTLDSVRATCGERIRDQGVIKSTQDFSLGFGFKWNVGVFQRMDLAPVAIPRELSIEINCHLVRHHFNQAPDQV